VDHPKDIGDRTTLAVMLVLREAGYAVFVPFGENTRYDLVLDDGERLLRIQCKTGRLRAGAVIWPACSSYAHHRSAPYAQRDYLGEIDGFAVYCRETLGVYLVPIEDVQVRRRGSLRVDPAKNGQRTFIREARRYEIGQVRVTAGPDATSGA
jgi:hypothetical protein